MQSAVSQQSVEPSCSKVVEWLFPMKMRNLKKYTSVKIIAAKMNQLEKLVSNVRKILKVILQFIKDLGDIIDKDATVAKLNSSLCNLC